MGNRSRHAPCGLDRLRSRCFLLDLCRLCGCPLVVASDLCERHTRDAGGRVGALVSTEPNPSAFIWIGGPRCSAGFEHRDLIRLSVFGPPVTPVLLALGLG